jgi:hypothetical protein
MEGYEDGYHDGYNQGLAWNYENEWNRAQIELNTVSAYGNKRIKVCLYAEACTAA